MNIIFHFYIPKILNFTSNIHPTKIFVYKNESTYVEIFTPVIFGDMLEKFITASTLVPLGFCTFDPTNGQIS